MHTSYGEVIPVKLLGFEMMIIKYIVFMILNKYFYYCNYKKLNDKEIWISEITHLFARLPACTHRYI